MTDTISRKSTIEYLMTNMGWCDEDGYTVDDADEKRKHIEDLINGVPDAGGWISVKDRLPDKEGKYIVAASERGAFQHITLATFGKCGRFIMAGRRAYWRATYWMPLPEPPKEE